MAANLSVTMKLIDQMSQKLESIANGGEKLSNNFTQMGSQADAAFEKATAGTQKVSEAMTAATASADGYTASNTQAEEALKKYGETTEENSEKVKEWGEETEGAGEKAKESSEKSEKAVVSLGEALAAAGIAMAIKEIVAAYMEFDDAADEFEASMAKVSTIADTTKVSLDEMQADISKLSQETGQSVNDLSESVYSAMSASVDTADAVNFVAQANALAVGGFTQSATAVDVLTTAINAYGLSADEAAAISDRLINTQNLGKTTVDELASSMGMVIPTAAAFNVNLDNLSSAYVTLTRNGINTANATTMLNGMLSELNDESKAVAVTLKNETGKSFAEMMDEGKNLGDVMEVLGNSVDGDAVAFMNLWSNVRAGRGAVNIFNAGAEEFSNVMDSMANSAGAADEAFQKMTNTGQFVEQKWTNAIENFKIAVGNAEPTLDGLMTKGTEILAKMTEFVNKNPAVVKTIAAGAAAVGTFVAVATTLTTVVKLGTMAMELFNATIAANPFMLAATAAAALVAGLVVLESSLNDVEERNNQLTYSSQNLSDRIEEQQKRVDYAAETWGEFDERTAEARIKLEELESQFESSGKTFGQLNEELEAVKQKMAESSEQYTEASKAIDKQAGSAMVLIQKLQNIESVSSKTAAQREIEAQLVDELNEAYPDLGLQYDSVTDKLNQSTDALKEYCKQQAEAAKKQADLERYTNALIEQSDAQDVLNDHIKEATAAMAEIQEIRERMMAAGEEEYPTEDIAALNIELSNAYDRYSELEKAVEDASNAYKEASDEVAEFESKIEGANNGLSEATGAAEEAAGQMEEFQKTLSDLFKSEDFQDDLEKIVDEIKGLYEGLQSTVSGSVGGMFDKVEMDVTHSGEEIRGALESQTEYFNKYKENLDQLNRLGFSEEFKQSFASGSKESAEELQGLINTIEKLEKQGESVSAFVLETQKAFDDMQEAEKTLTDTLADMNLEIQTKLEEAKGLVETGIKNLNLDTEAAAAAKATMDAYVAEIDAGARRAQTAIQTVASAVSAAMKAAESYSNSGGKVQKNAAGTTYGEDVYIAGEYGPELIVGRKGSEVFPATETAKILSAVMNQRESKADVELAPQEITNNIIHTSNSTNTNNENRNITLTIKGKGSLDIGQSVSKKDLHSFIADELEGAIASILTKEMYEEGVLAYEY